MSWARPMAPLLDFAVGRKPDSVRTSRRNRSSGTLWRRAAARAMSW